jgi:hypothetical protein
VFRPTKFALSAPELQKHYDKVWDGFTKAARHSRSPADS